MTILIEKSKIKSIASRVRSNSFYWAFKDVDPRLLGKPNFNITRQALMWKHQGKRKKGAKSALWFLRLFRICSFTSSVITYYLSYDIIWCVILFSIHYRQFSVKKIEFKETSEGPVVTLLPLPPNCKPCQIHYQMYLIRLSLHFNTCILVVSCFYT